MGGSERSEGVRVRAVGPRGKHRRCDRSVPGKKVPAFYI